MPDLIFVVTSPTVVLLDGTAIEGESASLYVLPSGEMFLQIRSKAVVTVPWGQIKTIAHD